MSTWGVRARFVHTVIETGHLASNVVKEHAATEVLQDDDDLILLIVHFTETNHGVVAVLKHLQHNNCNLRETDGVSSNCCCDLPEVVLSTIGQAY